MTLTEAISACRLCADRFAATRTAHGPPRRLVPARGPDPGRKPGPGAAGASSGKPFDDPSGVRLRDWMEMDEATFWDMAQRRHRAHGVLLSGLRRQGRRPAAAPHLRAHLARGGAGACRAPPGHPADRGPCAGLAPGQGTRDRPGARLAALAPRVFCLPHPSWRNTAWLKRHPWFETERCPPCAPPCRTPCPDDRPDPPRPRPSPRRATAPTPPASHSTSGWPRQSCICCWRRRTAMSMTPRLFDIEGTRYALAFDLPERLSAFAGAADAATLSGRRLAAMLAAEGLGLGLNLDDAPSAQLLDPAAMVWLTTTLAHAPRRRSKGSRSHLARCPARRLAQRAGREAWSGRRTGALRLSGGRDLRWRNARGTFLASSIPFRGRRWIWPAPCPKRWCFRGWKPARST